MADSIVTPYNVLLSGNFSESNNIDVGGGLAVGGSVAFGSGNNDQVADQLNNETVSAFPGQTTLISVTGVTSGTVGLKTGNYSSSGTINAASGYGSVSDPYTNLNAPTSAGSPFLPILYLMSTPSNACVPSGLCL